MTAAVDLPLWAALPVSLLVLLGAGLALAGSIGLLRLGSFLERLHAPALGGTLGIGAILLASMLFFSVAEGRAVLHGILVAAFLAVTAPVTAMLLAGAALSRDRRPGQEGPPPSPGGGAAGHPGAPAPGPGKAPGPGYPSGRP